MACRSRSSGNAIRQACRPDILHACSRACQRCACTDLAHAIPREIQHPGFDIKVRRTTGCCLHSADAHPPLQLIESRHVVTRNTIENSGNDSTHGDSPFWGDARARWISLGSEHGTPPAPCPVLVGPYLIIASRVLINLSAAPHSVVEPALLENTHSVLVPPFWQRVRAFQLADNLGAPPPFPICKHIWLAC